MTSMLRKGVAKSEEHLINQIKRRNDDTPNFALLIGAGASATSGVKLAKEMINEWRLQLYKQSRSNKSLEHWLADQDWYEDPEEYSTLFEEVYDEAPQRRNCIEDCIKGATPSWGYIYLANIIANNYFNVVFTPNFDDLLNEACFLYSSCRPLVCAHDSAVGSIRVTLKRQKIIKLHGDFLYDNIKNTRGETETLEKNMRDKFAQFAHEYGLVVIGYSGNDKSIMDTLEILLRTQGCFPHGIYWCLRKGSRKKRQLLRFLEKPRVYEVEITGFDDFMAKLHSGLGLVLPDVVKNPYQATTDRLNKFIGEKPVNSIINRDIESLSKQVNEIKDMLSHTKPPQKTLVPYVFLGDSALRSGDVKSAIDNLEKARNQNLQDKTTAYLLGIAYLMANKPTEARKIAEELKNIPTPTYLTLTNAAFLFRSFDVQEALKLHDLSLKLASTNEEKIDSIVYKANDLLLLKKYPEALTVVEEALKMNPNRQVAVINKALALKKLGRFPEIEALVNKLSKSIDDPYLKSGLYSLLNDKDNMIASLKMAIANYAPTIIYASHDPAFEDYRGVPEFEEILKLKPEKSSTKS